MKLENHLLTSILCLTVVLGGMPAASAGTLDKTCVSPPNDVADDCMDLRVVGSSTTKNDAIFYVPTAKLPGGTGSIDSFLRTQAKGKGDNNPNLDKVQSGYNTDGKREFDTKGGGSTHSLSTQTVIDNNTITINGIKYFEFILDINNNGKSPYLELSALELWLTDDAKLSGYNKGGDGTFNGNATKVYDLGANNQDNRILMDYNNYSGSGDPDLVALFPAHLIADAAGNAKNQYIVLYDNFNLYNDGFEEWARKEQGTFSGDYCTAFPHDPNCRPVSPPGSVPSPASLVLFITGLIGIARAHRQRSEAKKHQRSATTGCRDKESQPFIPAYFRSISASSASALSRLANATGSASSWTNTLRASAALPSILSARA